MMTIGNNTDGDLVNVTDQFYEDSADEEDYFTAQEDVDDDDSDEYFSAEEGVHDMDRIKMMAVAEDIGPFAEVEQPTPSATITEQGGSLPEELQENLAPEESPSGESDAEQEVPPTLQEELEHVDVQEKDDAGSSVNTEEYISSALPAIFLPCREADVSYRWMLTGSFPAYPGNTEKRSRPRVNKEDKEAQEKRILRKEKKFMRLLVGDKHFLTPINIIDPLSPSADNRRFTLFLECLPGNNLHNFLTTHCLIFFEVQCILRQIGEALVYLHSMNILHLNVNPKNILVNDILSIKLMDISQSTMGHGGRGPIGTRRFRAPEIETYDWGWDFFRRNSPYNFRVDYYSLGMTAIQMSANLFHVDFLRAILKKRKKKEEKYFVWIKALEEELNPDGTRDSYFDLLTRLLARKPEKRLGGRDFLSHVFFEEFFQVPLKRTELDPEQVRQTVLKYKLRKFHKEESCSPMTQTRKKFQRRIRKRAHAFDMTKERIITIAELMMEKYKQPKQPTFWRRLQGFFKRDAESPLYSQEWNESDVLEEQQVLKQQQVSERQEDHEFTTSCFF